MVLNSQPSERSDAQVPDANAAGAQELSQNTWSNMDQTTSRRDATVAEVSGTTLNGSVQFNYNIFDNSGQSIAVDRGATTPAEPLMEINSPYFALGNDAARARSRSAVAPGAEAVRTDVARAGENPRVEQAAPAGQDRRSPAEKLFDPAISPQDKLKLAQDLAKQGVRHLSGPDGRRYEISVQGTGNRAMVAIFGQDNRGRLHPMLRGIVNGDGSVSNQLGRSGKGVDFRGDWARRFDANNPLIGREGRTQPQPPGQPQEPRPRESQRQPQRPPQRPPQGDRPVPPQPRPQGDRPQTPPQPGPGELPPTQPPGDVRPKPPLPQPNDTLPPKPESPKPVVDSEFEYIRQNFKNLDKDNNDYITAAEVDKHLEENKGTLTEAEVTALTKLKQNIGNLEELHDDETFDENDGVTRNDLNDGEKRMKAFEFAEKNFDQIDGDKDGFLSAAELKSFAESEAGKKLPDTDKSSLDYLRNNISDIEEYSNDEAWSDEDQGITRKDLAEARKSDGTDGFRTRAASDTDQLPKAAPNTPPPMNREARVSQQEFKQEALRLFDQLDGDKDGFLSESELATAVQSNKYTGKDAQTVAALYRAQDDLEELNGDDEIGDENDGITKADLEKFDALQKEDSEWRKTAAQATTWLTENDKFKSLDTDNDKFLSYSEIQNALKAPGLSEAEKANLEFLKKNYSVLEDGHDDEYGIEEDGITLKDLDYSGNKTVGRVNGTLYATYEAQQTGTRDLYADKTNPLKSITPDAIRQGIIGDCYFESAVASVAATQPELIQQMIKDNGDGTYTVTFPGDRDQPITVDAPTESEMGLYNRSGKDGVWANVLEKAYGKYCQENPSHRSLFNMGGGNTITEGSDGGELFHGRSMSLLTGKGNDSDTLAFTSDATLKRKLTEAFTSNPKLPVLAGINNSFSDETDDGFPVAHMYSITDYDPNGPDGGTVTVRNPWGGGADSTSGTKKISLQQFRKNFSHITYSEK